MIIYDVNELTAGVDNLIDTKKFIYCAMQFLARDSQVDKWSFCTQFYIHIFCETGLLNKYENEHRNNPK